MSTLGIFSKARSPSADSPVARLFEVTMRGNAEMASQQAARKVATAQMDANDKTSVTIKNGRVTIKDADPALLDGTQQQDLQRAADAPHEAVDKALGTPDPLEPIYAVVDRTLHRRIPRPSDPDISEKLNTPEGIRALTLEIGGTEAHAREAVKMLREGKTTRERMTANVQAYRMKNLQSIVKSLKEPLNEAQDLAKRSDDELKSQIASQKERTGRLETIFKETDLADTPQTDWHTTVEKELGAPLTDFEKARVEQKGRRDVAKALDAFMNKDADALGQFASTDEALRAFGRPVSTEQRDRLDANWKAARRKVVTEDKRLAMADEASARASRAEIRAMQSAERAARTEQRMERVAQRQLTQAEKNERHGKIQNVLKQIDENNKEIIKNARELANSAKLAPEDAAWLRDRRVMLRSENLRLANSLGQYGVVMKTKPKAAPPKQPQYVDQEHWDKLIKSGFTEQQLAADGIVLKK